MWLTNQLSEERQDIMFETGVVEQINGGSVGVDSNSRVSNAVLVSPFGITALPEIGDEVLLLPISGGRFAAAGVIRPAKAGGETEIKAPSGAYIKLKADGGVEINGAVITKDGKLFEKQ